MSAYAKFEDMPQVKLSQLARMFEDAGMGPELVRALEQRPYLLTRCAEAVRAIIDEDMYYPPVQITIISDVDRDHWLSAGITDDGNEVRVQSARPTTYDAGPRLTLMWLPEGAVREIIVQEGEWVNIGYNVCIRYDHDDVFSVRTPRSEPLFAPVLS